MRKVISFIGVLIFIGAFVLGILSFAVVTPTDGSGMKDIFGRTLYEPSPIIRLITGMDNPSPGFLWGVFDTFLFFFLLFAGGKLASYGGDEENRGAT